MELASIEAAIQAWIEVTREAEEAAPAPSESLLNVGQAAERMGVSALLIRRYCASGLIPAVKVGRDWAIRGRDITVDAHQAGDARGPGQGAGQSVACRRPEGARLCAPVEAKVLGHRLTEGARPSCCAPLMLQPRQRH